MYYFINEETRELVIAIIYGNTMILKKLKSFLECI